MSRRLENHFANAKRVREIDVILVGLQTPHSRRFAHLHHCELAIIYVRITRFNLAAARIVRGHRQPFSAQCIRDYFRGPFAAIRHRHNVDFCVRQNFAQTNGNVVGDLSRGQRAFEFIRRD